MMERGKAWLRGVLGRAGWTVQRIQASPTLRFDGVTDDALEALYLASGRAFVFEAPLGAVRTGMNGFAGTAAAGDPLVATLVAFGRGECTSYGDSPLRAFYERLQPQQLAEAIGIDAQDEQAALRAPPINAPPLPWRLAPSNRARRLKAVEFEAHRERLGVAREDVDGILYYGPVTREFGEVTFARLCAVYRSIRERGYRPADHGAYIRCRLLVKGGTYRYYVETGKHRIAALAALGYERAEVEIGSPHLWRPVAIHRDDAASWPQVRSGFYTTEHAGAIFDRIFDGRPPARCVLSPPP